MNYWTQLSIEYAEQKAYLDDLFSVYPTTPDGIRTINKEIWSNVEHAYGEKNNRELLKLLFKMDLFPIKDSYVAYLKRDPSAMDRNPNTVDRLCGRLYEMGIEKIYDRCSEPKETNRQMGPSFSRWLEKGVLGVEPVSIKKFILTNNNAILKASDEEKKKFAKEYLNYNREKGLDFVGRFNNKYVIGEAKFLSAQGGSQNSDFEDAIATLKDLETDAIRIAILDGILYQKSKSKMYKFITNQYKDYNILSSLVLREFLYQL